MMKNLLLTSLLLIFISCGQKGNHDSNNTKATPLNNPITIAPVKNTIPDSIYVKVHSIIDNTQEYQSLKKQYKDKLELLVYPTENQSMFEVSIGHIIFDRFSTSLRLLVDIISKDIKVYDFDKNSEVTLVEYRIK